MYAKNRRQNIAVGWSMFGGGMAMILGGLAINVGSDWGPEHKNDGLWLSYLGIGVTLGSIPVLISAHKNKVKANLALKREHVAGYKKIYTPGFTALALAIRL